MKELSLFTTRESLPAAAKIQQSQKKKKKIPLKREKGKENIGEHSATEDFCFTDGKTMALKDYLPGPR